MMERVIIGRNFYNQPRWKRMVSVPLIYLPLLTTVPFLMVAVILIKFHLTYVGGLNIRPYGSFVPAWVSHRYRYEDQITFQTGTSRFQLQAQRWFWIFNCEAERRMLHPEDRDNPIWNDEAEKEAIKILPS